MLRRRMDRASRERMMKTGKAFNEFIALPKAGRAATTTGPSIRNAVYNTTTLPKDIIKTLAPKKTPLRNRRRTINRAAERMMFGGKSK